MKLTRLLATALLLVGVSAAQTTWSQHVFTNQSTAVRSTVVRNINQASHWVIYCASVATTGGTIAIQGSADGVNWKTISNVGPITSNGCGMIQAGGYYSQVTLLLQNLTGTPSVTADYFCSTGAISTPANAGYQTLDQPVTFVPVQFSNTNSALKSAAYQVATVSAVLFAATVYNPNAGVVYVAFGASATPFAGGGASVFMVPVPATSAVTVALPTAGIYFGSSLYEGCSTSSTSAVDPASNCIVSTAIKQIASYPLEVPN